MRFIKLGILSFVVLFALLTAMSMLLPSTVVVSRPIDLQASPDSVQAYVENLQNWEQWLVHDDTSGFTINQTAKEVHYQNTKITVLSSKPGQVITEWQVGDGEKMKGEFNVISHSNQSTVTLQWQFINHVKWYPWEKFASILSDRALGPYMEKSLLTLKEKVEKKDRVD